MYTRPSHLPMRRLFTLAALLVALLPVNASAHPLLVRSDPSDGAVLSSSPGDIHLWFSEPLIADMSTLELRDLEGQPVSLASPPAFSPDRRQVVLNSPPDLRGGAYSVSWSILSETDGHATRGQVVFGVGAAVEPVAALQPVLPPLEAPLRGLDLLLLAGLVGGLATVFLVLAPIARRGLEPGQHLAVARALRRTRRLAVVAGVMALLVGLALLAWQLLVLGETGLAGWTLLTNTRWGLLWLSEEGFIVALVCALLVPRRVPPLLFVALIAAFAASHSLAGHAAAVESATAAAVLADMVHLLAASVWIGGLAALLLAVPRSGMERSMLLACLGRFSRLAAVSLGLLIVTGLYSASLHVASADALLLTAYGQALTIKTGLTALVAVLGLSTALALHPGLARAVRRMLGRLPNRGPIPIGRLAWLLGSEAALGLAALMLAGLLGASPPATDPAFVAAAPREPAALSQQVDDLLVALDVKPNLPGANILQLLVSTSRRPALAPLGAVRVRIYGPSGEPVEEAAPVRMPVVGAPVLDGGQLRQLNQPERLDAGLFRVGTSALVRAGNWRATVIISRPGLPDATASFAWAVSPPPVERAVVISHESLAPILGLLAGLAMAGLLAAVVAWLLTRYGRGGLARGRRVRRLAPVPVSGVRP